MVSIRICVLFLGPGGICHLEVSSIGSSTCLDVRVGFAALNVSGVFDVVFVVVEVSEGLLGVGCYHGVTASD